jgi:hypothetical protein
MGDEKYDQLIEWAIHKKIPARRYKNGYFGKRIRQADERVNSYELKINPNDESFYISKSDGKLVQFENINEDVLQDGKLIQKTPSIYHTDDKPYAHNTILEEAKRQIDAAQTHGLRVEWLVSDQKAVEQLKNFFNKNNIPIQVTYLPE